MLSVKVRLCQSPDVQIEFFQLQILALLLSTSHRAKQIQQESSRDGLNTVQRLSLFQYQIQRDGISRPLNVTVTVS